MKGNKDNMKPNTKKVWDIFIRVFHWSLAFAFTLSFISGENDEYIIHEYSGYTIGVLIVLRLIWGFIGTKHALFKDFIFSPTHIIHYTRQLIKLKPPKYRGHNPLGGLMTIALLVSISIAVISGMLLLAVEDFAGPLGFIAVLISDSQAELIETIHENITLLILFLVLIHIGGVVLDIILHKQNIIKSMFTGTKKVD